MEVIRGDLFLDGFPPPTASLACADAALNDESVDACDDDDDKPFASNVDFDVRLILSAAEELLVLGTAPRRLALDAVVRMASLLERRGASFFLVDDVGVSGGSFFG